MTAEPNNEQEQSATVIDQSVQDNEPRTEAELEAAFEQMQAQQTSAQTSDESNQPDQNSDQDNNEEQESQADSSENTEDVASDNGESKTKAPNRVRLSELDERDRAIVANAVQLVRDGLASSISDAVAMLSGGRQSAADETSEKASTETESTQELDEFDAQIAEQDQEIAVIEEALAKARADFDEDMVSQLNRSLLNAYAQKIKLETKKEIFSEQKRAQEELEARQQQLSEYESEYQRYRDIANELYPDGAKPGTPMFEEIRRVVAWFEQNNPEIFQTPNYPLAIAGFAAASLAKSGKQANGSAANPSAKKQTISPTGQARGPARPTDVLVGDDATSAATNAQNVLAHLDGITNEQDLERLAEAVFAGS